MSSRTRTGLSGSGTRVVLIGTGTHTPESGLPDVPAVRTTLADLADVFVQRCGVDNLRTLRNPASTAEIGLALTESAEQATDVLVVYYVGHGLVSVAGELYLATAATDRRPNRIAYTGLAYAAVRDSLLQSPARSIVVILDCCFSGRAAGVLAGTDDSALPADLARVHGGYVLASAARDELAHAPPGERHTAFTGELVRLLRDGDPTGPPELTLSHVFKHLSRTLPARGFPRPHRRASEWIDDLVLAPNVASAQGHTTDDTTEFGDVCPYPGLAAFDVGDARCYFGRERVVAELLGRLAARLEQATPLLVVGASGSGKSSLLRAGLLHALAEGKLLVPGSRTWSRHVFTPTADPVGVLAGQVGDLVGLAPAVVRTQLLGDPDGLAATVRDALRARSGGRPAAGVRAVLVVDQFEETFTQCQDEGARQTFIRALCAMAGTGDSGRTEPAVLVVIGIRADLYGRCAAHPALLPALQDGQVVLGPMRGTELRDAIEQPARLADLVLEPGLVDELLHDLGVDPAADDRLPRDGTSHDPGVLPLLAHALAETWQHREERTLTRAGYTATGGIRGAIAVTAERTFRLLDDAQRLAARRLLLRLVHVGDDGAPDTRLRVDITALLAQSTDQAATSTVIDAFAGARLVTLHESTAEITHDALLRAWPRLRGWIDADRAGLYVHQQLTEAAQTWHQHQRSGRTLYRDTALDVAVAWAREPHHHDDLGPLERSFLAASRTRRTRRRRLRVGSVGALVLVAVVLGVAGIVNLVRSPPPVYVTDGSHVFDTDLGPVEKLIQTANQQVVSSHEPYVSIAFLAPLSSGGGADPLSRDVVRHELEGAYLAQNNANHASGRTRLPLVQLLLADEGPGETAWHQAAVALEQRVGTSDRLVAVTGLGLSTSDTAQTIKELGSHRLAMVGSTFTDDSMMDGVPGVVRIGPTNTDEARAAVHYLDGAPGVPAGAHVLLAQDENTGNRYATTLGSAFVTALAADHTKKMVLTGRLPFESPSSGQADDFQPLTADVCLSDPDVVYFAGRAEDLRSFLLALARSPCASRRLDVVTGDDASTLVGRNSLTGISPDVDVVSTVLADPQMWTAEPTATSPTTVAAFGHCVTCFQGLFPHDSLTDGEAIMTHDAVLTAVVATRDANALSGVLPNSGDVARELPLSAVPGASGWFCFDGGHNPTGKAIPVVRIGQDSKETFLRVTSSTGRAPGPCR